MSPPPNALHLRRIQCKQDGHSVIKHHDHNLVLLDTLTKFGRNPDMVDIVLTSAVYSNMISRNHAEISGKRLVNGAYEKYMISDHSLNGTYINERRINGVYQLREGDVIKFGHMNGAAVRPGQTAPQANAEFTFMVERALPAADYLGVDSSGRRVVSLTCKGQGEVLTLNDDGAAAAAAAAATIVKKEEVAASPPVVATSLPPPVSSVMSTPTAALPGSAATTTPPISLPSGFPFSAQNPYLSPQLMSAYYAAATANVSPQNYLLSTLGARGRSESELLAAAMAQSAAGGFRMPQMPAFSAAGNSALALQHHQLQALGHNLQVPSSSAASLFPGGLTQQNLAQFGLTPSNENLMTLLSQQQQRQAQAAAAVPSSSLDLKPTIKTEAIKQQVASPPMECDSSVPSPPKVQIAAPPALPTTTLVPPAAAAAPAPVRAASPKSTTNASEDQRSERSYGGMTESPPPPRAPAPFYANRPPSTTPSPRPLARSETPEKKEAEKEQREKEEREREKRAKEEEKERREREKRLEKDRKREEKKDAKEKEKTTPHHKKSNELSRLFNDLTEGSWMQTARKTTSDRRRPSEQDFREKDDSDDSEAEKKRRKKDKEERKREKEFLKEKEKEREKERERQRERELEKERAKAKEREYRAAMTLPKKGPLPPTKARPMRQLSDVSSGTSSDEEEEKPKKKGKQVEKKKAADKRKSPDSDSDSSDEGSERSGKKLGKKPLKEKAKQDKGKKAVKVVKKKKKKSESSEDDDDVEEEEEQQVDRPVAAASSSSQEEPCHMGPQCVRPAGELVNWVACDRCEEWYHTQCILGSDDAPADDKFFCGYCDNGKKKEKGKKKGK